MFVALKKCDSAIQISTVSSVLVLSNNRTFDLSSAEQRSMESKCLFLSGPIFSLQGLLASVQLSAVYRALSQGESAP